MYATGLFGSHRALGFGVSGFRLLGFRAAWFRVHGMGNLGVGAFGFGACRVSTDSQGSVGLQQIRFSGSGSREL